MTQNDVSIVILHFDVLCHFHKFFEKFPVVAPIMISEKPKLLLCPFCGGTPRLMTGPGAYFQWNVWVECELCHCRTVHLAFGNNGSIMPDDCTYAGGDDAAKYVAKVWNRRFPK